MIERGGIYWVDPGEPHGSTPGKRRPVLVVQSDSYNASRLGTVVAAVITSNTSLASLPGNLFLPASASGLPRDATVNVTAIVTLDKSDLGDPSTTFLATSPTRSTAAYVEFSTYSDQPTPP